MIWQPTVIRIGTAAAVALSGAAVLLGCVYLQPLASWNPGVATAGNVAIEIGQCRTHELAADAARAWSRTFDSVSSVQVLATSADDYPYVFVVIGQRTPAVTYVGPEGNTLAPDEEYIAEFPLKNGTIQRWRRTESDVRALVAQITQSVNGTDVRNLPRVRRLLDQDFWLGGDDSEAKAACATACGNQSCPRVGDVAGCLYFDCSQATQSCRAPEQSDDAE